MKILGLLLSLFLIALVANAASTPKTAKVAISKNGRISYNGKTITLENLKPKLKALKKGEGTVWYYREDAAGAPPPAAMETLKLIMSFKLSMVMSSKADFSDVVDDHGISKLE